MSQADYDRGFNEGLQWVAQQLRRAAALVETPIYADFERKSGNGSEGRVYRGVAKTGHPHFAQQLRSVAAEIESATKAPQDGTQT